MYDGRQVKLAKNKATTELRRASKQVYDEGLPVLYGDNSFILETSIRFFYLHIGSKAAACIQQISIRNCYDLKDGFYVFSSISSLKTPIITIKDRISQRSEVFESPYTPGASVVGRAGYNPNGIPKIPFTLPHTVTEFFVEKAGLEVCFENLIQVETNNRRD
jgi:hypothetical protein